MEDADIPNSMGRVWRARDLKRGVHGLDRIYDGNPDVVIFGLQAVGGLVVVYMYVCGGGIHVCVSISI